MYKLKLSYYTERFFYFHFGKEIFLKLLNQNPWMLCIARTSLNPELSLQVEDEENFNKNSSPFFLLSFQNQHNLTFVLQF